MTQVAQLDALTNISGTMTIPTVSAASNRKLYFLISALNGGGNSTAPTSVTAAGQVATLEYGTAAGASESRATCGIYSIKESQITAMVGSSLVIVGGTTGERSVLTFSVKDAHQTDYTGAYAHSGATSSTSVTTASFQRATDGYTVALYRNALLTIPTLANPTKTADINTGNSYATYGFAASTNSLSASSATVGSATRNALAVVNIPPIPSQTVDSINGDSTSPDIYTGAENTLSTTGFGTIISGTLATTGAGSVAVSITGGGTGFTRTWPPTEGVVAPYFGAVRATFSDGSKSGYIDGTLLIPTGFAEVTFLGVITNDGISGNSYLGEGGDISLPDGFRLTYPTGNGLVIDPDGKITCDNPFSNLSMYLQSNVDYKYTTVILTVTEDGGVTVDTTPDAGTFGGITGVNTSTVVQLPTTVTISGMSAGAAPDVVATAGTEYRVSTDGVSYGAWTSTTTPVQNTYKIQARKVSSPDYLTSTTATVTVDSTVFTGTITTKSDPNITTGDSVIDYSSGRMEVYKDLAKFRIKLPYQANSVAADVATLRTDLNSLITKMTDKGWFSGGTVQTTMLKIAIQNGLLQYLKRLKQTAPDQMTVQAASVAADVTALRADFNALLTKLKASNLMASS